MDTHTHTVSLIDISCRLKNPCSREALGAAIAGASQSHMRGILDLCSHRVNDPIPTASKDYNHDSRSCIVDLNACTCVDDKFIKVVAFYDNEFAYAARLLDLCLFVEAADKEGQKPLLLAPAKACPMMSAN